MTYEELKKQTNDLLNEQKKAYAKYSNKINKLNADYIEEHKPLDVKRFQRIVVRLSVTEESRQFMDEKHRAMTKNQVGSEYRLAGVFNWWGIGKDGQVKPSFYGKPSYSAYDKVVSVELAKEQPEGDCTKCTCYKDGRCYMMGGKDLGVNCSVWKITDDMVVCPRYEEVVPNGLWGKLNIYPHKHHPCVSFVRDLKGKKTYRIYSGNWQYFTEHSEEEVKKYYSFDPIDYGDEK